jgi:ankyrin repeat protein
MTDKALRDHAPSRDDSFATVVNLCNAARAGDLPRVQQLLHADPALATRTISQNGQLAIQCAAREGHTPIVRLLLEAGANPLQGIYPNRGATSALACARDREHVEIVQLIEEHLEQHPAPQPAPDQAARLLAAVADDDLNAAKELLESDPALANAEANAEAARKLRKEEISANRPAIFPLHLAAQLGLLEMARLLLDVGADPDAAFDMDLGDEGNYRNAGEPLWLAAAGQHRDLCALLLERGADPNAYVFASGPAAERALENGNDEILDLIYSYGGKNFAVAAALCGRMAVPAETMALNPELAPQILWGAALGGNVDLVRLCFTYDLGDLDWFGLLYQPLRGRPSQAELRYADGQRDQLEDKVEILRIILENGADPSARDAKNMTPLHRLAGETSRWTDEEKVPLALLLLDFGADIEACDDELQSTPLGHAARYGHAKLAEYLLERGARTDLPTDEPWAKPLAWAEKQGHDHIAEMLRQRGAER